MTDWISEAEEACEAAKSQDLYDNINMMCIAHTAFPRALAVIRAADEFMKIYDEEMEDRWLSDRMMDAAASYRKARHADTS